MCCTDGTRQGRYSEHRGRGTAKTRRDVHWKHDERREPARHHRQAHSSLGNSPPVGFVPIENAEWDAVIGKPEIEKHRLRCAVQDLMDGMPLVVDQHLRDELVESQVGPNDDGGGECRKPPWPRQEPRVAHDAVQREGPRCNEVKPAPNGGRTSNPRAHETLHEMPLSEKECEQKL